MSKLVVVNTVRELAVPAEQNRMEYPLNLRTLEGQIPDFLDTIPARKGDVFVVSFPVHVARRLGNLKRKVLNGKSIVRHLPFEGIAQSAPSYILQRTNELGFDCAMQVFIKPDNGKMGRFAVRDLEKMDCFFNISTNWGCNRVPEDTPYHLDRLRQTLERMTGEKIAPFGLDAPEQMRLIEGQGDATSQRPGEEPKKMTHSKLALGE